MAGGGGFAGAATSHARRLPPRGTGSASPCLGDPRDGVYTVVEWLETWVETRARLRDSTRRMYQGHIRLYFRRLLDGVLLRELHIGHVQDAFQRLVR